MLGSQASQETVEYVQSLVKEDIDMIFVFGGLNSNIKEKVESHFGKSTEGVISVNEKQTIILLGYQAAPQMLPIFTRSQILVLRGGGLTTMEQLAMKHHHTQKIFIHYSNEPTASLNNAEQTPQNAQQYYGLFFSSHQQPSSSKSAHRAYLRSRLTWEDENAQVLISNLGEQGLRVLKTTPTLFKEDLREQQLESKRTLQEAHRLMAL